MPDGHSAKREAASVSLPRAGAWRAGESHTRAGGEADDELLSIRKEQTVIRFSVGFLGLLRVRGELTGARGSVLLSERAESCTVDVSVPVASLRTGVALRDRHLRGRFYFDDAAHPDIVFRSEAVTAAGDGWCVAGSATVAGAHLPLSFTVERIPRGNTEAPAAGQVHQRYSYRATATLDRRLLHFRGTPLLGRWLLLDDLVIGRTVRIEVVASLRD